MSKRIVANFVGLAAIVAVWGIAALGVIASLNQTPTPATRTLSSSMSPITDFLEAQSRIDCSSDVEGFMARRINCCINSFKGCSSEELADCLERIEIESSP